MKKLLAIAVLVASSLLFAPPAAAGEKMTGRIVKIDEGARTITFRQDKAQKDAVLQVDRAVDLKAVKARDRAHLTVDAGVVKGIEREAAAAGY